VLNPKGGGCTYSKNGTQRASTRLWLQQGAQPFSGGGGIQARASRGQGCSTLGVVFVCGVCVCGGGGGQARARRGQGCSALQPVRRRSWTRGQPACALSEQWSRPHPAYTRHLATVTMHLFLQCLQAPHQGLDNRRPCSGSPCALRVVANACQVKFDSSDNDTYST
jgi:hypothetical protein